MSLSTILKRIIPGDYKNLYQAGYLNEELKLTDAGRTALDHVNLQAHLADLVEMANARIADQEAEAAKNK